MFSVCSLLFFLLSRAAGEGEARAEQIFSALLLFPAAILRISGEERSDALVRTHKQSPAHALDAGAFHALNYANLMSTRAGKLF